MENVNVNECVPVEEVTETTEEIVTKSSGKILKTFGIIGGVLLAGGLAYKFIVKPRRNKKRNEDEFMDFDDEFENDSEAVVDTTAKVTDDTDTESEEEKPE